MFIRRSPFRAATGAAFLACDPKVKGDAACNVAPGANPRNGLWHSPVGDIAGWYIWGNPLDVKGG
jgi:hypothetical protein